MARGRNRPPRARGAAPRVGVTLREEIDCGALAVLLGVESGSGFIEGAALVEVEEGSPAEASGISVSFGVEEAAFVEAVDAPRPTPPVPRAPRARARARPRARPRLPLGAPSPSIVVLFTPMKWNRDRCVSSLTSVCNC